ncbi:hypothetical protein QBC35DRAFT_19885 [Podospora australis]|uniref:DUF1917-domain-containing protein n=1 Tax=Podospora australis TaxID=1536484 RepID=A0AAN6WNN0_9PEZI|nr:hypothetical protein QBC35DRAFT_19885 [Podospora australis]
MDSDSEFYGNEKTVSKLRARVANTDVSSYWSGRKTVNPISARLSHGASSHVNDTVPSSPGSLYNPFSGMPHAAHTETIDAFLERLPPATTDRTPDLPWIWIANRHFSVLQAVGDETKFIQGGKERLRLFTEFIETTSARAASPFVATRLIAQARKAAIDHLTALAEETKLLEGKWMLFPSPGRVNQVWASVARATANNELGISAKVATRDQAYAARLICVYTRDFRDKSDVARVLKRLMELELVRPGKEQIYYKCDAWTYMGINHGNEWGIPASIYSSNDVFNYMSNVSPGDA